jgi:hypothetical protein
MHASTMVLDDLPYQCESQTDTFAGFARAAGTIERFEYALALVFRYSRAAVFNREQHTAALIARHARLNLATVRMTARVLKQISQ